MNFFLHRAGRRRARGDGHRDRQPGPPCLLCRARCHCSREVAPVTQRPCRWLFKVGSPLCGSAISQHNSHKAAACTEQLSLSSHPCMQVPCHDLPRGFLHRRPQCSPNKQAHKQVTRASYFQGSEIHLRALTATSAAVRARLVSHFPYLPSSSSHVGPPHSASPTTEYLVYNHGKSKSPNHKSPTTNF